MPVLKSHHRDVMTPQRHLHGLRPMAQPARLPDP